MKRRILWSVAALAAGANVLAISLLAWRVAILDAQVDVLWSSVTMLHPIGRTVPPPQPGPGLPEGWTPYRHEGGTYYFIPAEKENLPPEKK